MNESQLFDWESIPEEPMPSEGGTVLRRFVSRGTFTAARVTFDAGAAVPEHSHPNEQICFVLSGQMEFRIEGKPVVIDAGQFLHLPPYVRHGARAIVPSIVLDVFNPPRTDWETRH